MALKVTKINRRVKVYVKGHGYFEAGQERELNELIDDQEKQLLSQRSRIQVSGKPSKSAAKSKPAVKAEDGAEAPSNDNS